MKPLPMRLECPQCKLTHVDRGEWKTKPHTTHLGEHCGHEWAPATFTTVGVKTSPVYLKYGEFVVFSAVALLVFVMSAGLVAAVVEQIGGGLFVALLWLSSIAYKRYSSQTKGE